MSNIEKSETTDFIKQAPAVGEMLDIKPRWINIPKGLAEVLLFPSSPYVVPNMDRITNVI